MKNIFRYLLLFLLLLFPQVITATTIPYIPKIINYSVSDYKAGNQNWSVTQGNDGKIYFGNNRGLLVYDGIRWKLYQLSNQTPIRSVYISSDNRIYIGSFEEFGYYQEDRKGELIYHSLKALIKDFRFNNDEVWRICEYNGKIYFQSFSSYFIYNGESAYAVTTDLLPHYFFSVNGRLYAQFIKDGFYVMHQDEFKRLIPVEQLNNDHVVSVLPYGNQLLLVTSKSGLFLYNEGRLTAWPVSSNDLIKRSVANRAVCMPDSSYVIGTISNGLIAIDKNGKQLWHINRENSLIDNTILGLHVDDEGNLWVAKDNGISQVQVNSPLYFYEPVAAQIGMVHDMAIKNNHIYLATNQGIYKLSEKNMNPHLIPGTEEQTWYITDVGSQLIAGHNKGTISIKNDEARFIEGPSVGGTALRKFIIHGKEVLIQVSYISLSIFTQKVTGEWEFSHNVEGFSNLIKSFEVDPAGTIWASHMFRGLYRITLDETLQKVKHINYIGKLQSDQNEGKINVMKLRGRIVLTDGKQFYTYEDLSDSIVPYDLLNKEFPDLGDTYRVVSLHNNLFWFIRNTEYVLLSYEGGRFILRERIPFTIFENPTIENRGNIFITSTGLSYFCLNGGLALYAPTRNERQSINKPLTLSSVKIYDRNKNINSLLPVKPESITFPFKYNNITFELAYPEYNKQHTTLHYKLEGYDQEWAEATPDFVITYSNLPYGEYNLCASVKNSAGIEVATLSYPFKVKPPFYRSIWAIILYLISGLSLFILLIRLYIRKEVLRKNKSIETQRQKQKEQLEKQGQLIVQLKNEQLEQELTYKSKELASATLAHITQTDFLEELKKEIQTQQLSGTYTKRFFEKIIHMIDEKLTNEDEWALYQANFDRVHEKFFFKLKERYPELTPGDLRMCALLRLNMPTKDMAKMLNLSVRGIEAARYRLRKKLNLSEGENLVDFMIKFS
jgi:hypothetical protein